MAIKMDLWKTSATRKTPIVSNSYLYETIYGPSDRWSKFRRWLENRFDRIGLPYVWPRVKRDEIKPKAVVIGGVLYAHPSIIDQIRHQTSVISGDL